MQIMINQNTNHLPVLRLTAKTMNRCSYRTPSGRRCRNLRQEPLLVCNRHLSYDERCVTHDISNTVRQLRCGAPYARLDRKLRFLVATDRLPPDLARALMCAGRLIASTGRQMRDVSSPGSSNQLRRSTPGDRDS
jgi:hypothetical protein